MNDRIFNIELLRGVPSAAATQHLLLCSFIVEFYVGELKNVVRVPPLLIVQRIDLFKAVLTSGLVCQYLCVRAEQPIRIQVLLQCIYYNIFYV